MKKLIMMTIIVLSSWSVFAKTNPQVVNLSVTENGFDPKAINVKPGVPVVLKITRKTDSTCSTQIQIPDKKVKKDLPLNEEVAIEIGALKKGEIRFGCGMNMMDGGKIFVQ